MVFVGDVSWQESAEPIVQVNPEGLDVRFRKYRGAVTGLQAFLNNLSRGSTGYGLYLTGWTNDDHPQFPTVYLTTMGLIRTKDAIISNDKTIQNYTISTEEPEAATREIQYYSPVTTYRYISNSRVTAPTRTGVFGEIVVLSSVIRTDDGKVYKGLAPAALVSALQPAQVILPISVKCDQIPATPYFQVEETVAKVYKPQ